MGVAIGYLIGLGRSMVSPLLMLTGLVYFVSAATEVSIVCVIYPHCLISCLLKTSDFHIWVLDRYAHE